MRPVRSSPSPCWRCCWWRRGMRARRVPAGRRHRVRLARAPEQADAETVCRRHLARRHATSRSRRARATCSRRVPDPPGRVPRGRDLPARPASRARSSSSRSETCARSDRRHSRDAARRTRRSAATGATSRSRPRDQLVAADVNTSIDVYVRDMERADRLAGARSSSSRRATAATQPATYGGPPAAVTGADITAEARAQRGRPQGRVRAPARRRICPRRTSPHAGRPAVRARPRRQHDDARDAQQAGRHARPAAPRPPARSRRSARTARPWPGTGQNAGLPDAPPAGRDRRAPSTTSGGASRTGRPPPRGASPARPTWTTPAARSRTPWLNDESASGPCYGPLAEPGGLAPRSTHRHACRR